MTLQISSLLEPREANFLKHFATLVHPMRAALQTLLLASDYACRHIDIITLLLKEDDCLTPLSLKEYSQLIDQLPALPFNRFPSELRRFRHRHFLRLMLRELSGLATTEETIASWSDCADAIILRAMSVCHQQLPAHYGQPCDEKGKATSCYILAMGKLGGRELNYSSDIDLIIAFSAAGYTNGEEQISNQQYYSKLVQHFIQLLQQNSADGFVFRVDLRLRPNGESGALVSTLAAMETYYQEQGRDWERYAMVKARIIGEQSAGRPLWFQRLIVPFVYRRYVDFSVIESLRSMKAMIEREVQLNPMLDDIKRGLGGIREIEFIIQNIQLIRGGRLVHIRCQSVLAALDALKQEGLLARQSVIRQAYLFLRKLENALQGQNDQQTHSLPKDQLKQAQIACLMGYSTWDELLGKLQQYQRIISSIFRSVLNSADSDSNDNRLIATQLSSLWQGHVESSMAANLLESLGFEQGERCYQLLHAFRHSPRCRRLTQAVRLRLDRFMVLLLSELSQVAQTDKVLLQVLQLLENIVGRSAYLALLTENPQVIRELLHWFANSPFITSLIVSQPFLLEILLDQKQNWRLPTTRQLKQKLKEQLKNCTENEQKNDVLRQFKLSNWLYAARAELYGQYDAIRIGRFLAEVAYLIVCEVFTISCQELKDRYPAIKALKSRFAILAYGKLGSQEMNFNSDLDLVFIHTARPEEESLIIRLTQKILHMLTTRAQAGVLYSVDTRLRPSGAAGLLVSHLDAFIDYQRNQAWTWEHQALIRVRVILGNAPIRFLINQLKKDVILRARDTQILAEEVWAMRAKINRYTEDDQVKYGAGGLLDLEFLTQYLVLAHPQETLCRHTNTLDLLRILYAENVLTQDQFIRLKQSYIKFHHLLHLKVLKTGTEDAATDRAEVRTISALLGNLSEGILPN